MKRLCNIKDDSLYSIESLTLPPDMQNRLQELGVIKGTNVRMLFCAPSGDPKAYLIRGAQIALRRECSENIWVTETP